MKTWKSKKGDYQEKHHSRSGKNYFSRVSATNIYFYNNRTCFRRCTLKNKRYWSRKKENMLATSYDDAQWKNRSLCVGLFRESFLYKPQYLLAEEENNELIKSFI